MEDAELPAVSAHWDDLAFELASALVPALTVSLPRHQALSAVAALRLCSQRWRGAVDDALQDWQAPSQFLVERCGSSSEPLLARLLRRFRNLRSLGLDWTARNGWADQDSLSPVLDPSTLQALASLRRLASLSLSGCCPTQELFRTVASLPALLSFAFEPSENVGAAAAAIGSSAIGGSGASQGWGAGAGPAPLAACPVLQSLDLRSFPAAGVEADVSAILRGTTGLRHLGLYRTIRATAMLAHHSCDLGLATQLTSLDVSCTFTPDDAFLELFSRLTNLRHLDASGCRHLTDDGFLGITQLAPTLTSLALRGGHRVSEDGATALARLPNLAALDLAFGNAMCHEGLLPMLASSLPQLTRLDVRGCHRALTSLSALEQLSTLHRLHHLSAQGCRLGQSAVSALAGIACLRHLDISDNSLRGSLQPLTRLSQLEFLDVSECQLSDEHVVPLLAGLPQVHTLSLDSNASLSTAVLEALASGPASTSLQVLSLTQMRLEGPAALRLLPRLTRLQVLDVTAAQFTSGALADGEALLAAADVMPALHTLIAPVLWPLPSRAWRELVEAGAGQRRLLRVVA